MIDMETELGKMEKRNLNNFVLKTDARGRNYSPAL
jgi:hypothetical protein